MNKYFKIKTGFREEEYYTLPIEEAHKAYYLFFNPNERGVFSTGLALIGKTVQAIEPDYHATMGWNKGHRLEPEDYEELTKKGIDRQIRDELFLAKEIATNRRDLINLSLSDAKEKAGLKLLIQPDKI